MQIQLKDPAVNFFPIFFYMERDFPNAIEEGGHVAYLSGGLASAFLPQPPQTLPVHCLGQELSPRG